jgi:hypothetical protein
VTQNGWIFTIALAVALIAYPIIRVVRKNRYFNFDEFHNQ